MSHSAFSPQFNTKLATLKYARWAVDLSEDTLEALLSMVGEYGIRAARFGVPPEDAMPDVLPSDTLGNARAKEALRVIAGIVTGDRTNFEEASRRIVLAIARWTAAQKEGRSE